MAHIEFGSGNPTIFIIKNIRRRDKHFLLYAVLWMFLFLGVFLYAFVQVQKSIASYDSPDERLTFQHNDELRFPPLVFCASNPEVSSFQPQFCRFAPLGPGRKPVYYCDVVQTALELEVNGERLTHKCVIVRGQTTVANDTVLRHNGALGAPVVDAPPPVAVDKSKPVLRLNTSSSFRRNVSQINTSSSADASNMSLMMRKWMRQHKAGTHDNSLMVTSNLLELEEGMSAWHPGNSGVLDAVMVANATVPISQFQISFSSGSKEMSFRHLLFHILVRKTVTDDEAEEHKYTPSKEDFMNPVITPLVVDSWTKLYPGHTDEVNMKLKTVTFLDGTVVHTYPKTIRPVPCALPFDSKPQDCSTSFSAHIRFDTLNSDDAQQIVTFDWMYVMGAVGGALTIANLAFLLLHPMLQRVVLGKHPSDVDDSRVVAAVEVDPSTPEDLKAVQ